MRYEVARRLSNHELRLECAANGIAVPDGATRGDLLAAVTGSGSNGPSRNLHNWSAEDVATLHAHPDWTAAELAEALGVTEASVKYARRTYGRWSSNASGLCVSCDQRPVYVESKEARRLGLCKGCWLEEQRKRLEEDAESTRLRQAKHRKKGDMQ